jgi:hypothetical protein
MSGEGIIPNAAAPHRPWYERYVSNVTEARRYLLGLHIGVFRHNSILHPQAPNAWKVAGYSGTFDDAEMIAWLTAPRSNGPTRRGTRCGRGGRCSTGRS